MSHKKTTTEFAKEVISLTRGQYRLESAYKSAHTPVKIKHLACGTTFIMKPNSFLCGQRCSNAKCKKKAIEIARWEDSYNRLLDYIKDYPDYSLLTSFKQYRGANKYIRIYHSDCGTYYNVTPHAFMRGRRCPTCAKTSRATKLRKGNALAIIQDNLGKGYEVQTKQYEKVTQRIAVKHLVCGHIYSRKASTLLNGFGECPYCYEKRGTYIDTLLRLIKDQNCKLVSSQKDFYNSKELIRIKHLACGHTIKIRVNRLKFPRSKNGDICKYCNRKAYADLRKKSNDEFLKEFNKRIDSSDYQIITKYDGAHTKLRIKHLVCGNTFDMEASALLKGYSCPICSHFKKSVGENLVAKYLDKYQIKYEYPKSYKDLKDTSNLRYDFYLPDYNTLIEYQGKQHFQPLSYFGGKKSFAIQVKHDQMKRDYARDHGINLIEINWKSSYKDKMQEIESKLASIISKSIDRVVSNYKGGETD